MKFALEFDDYYRLLALHRALMEAKFCDVPNDPVVAGSPLVAELADKVVDALIKWPNVPGGSNEWASWRKLDPSRREWTVALNRAASETWPSLDAATKRKLAKQLLSPLVATPDLLERFVAEVDDRTHG